MFNKKILILTILILALLLASCSQPEPEYNIDAIVEGTLVSMEMFPVTLLAWTIYDDEAFFMGSVKNETNMVFYDIKVAYVLCDADYQLLTFDTQIVVGKEGLAPGKHAKIDYEGMEVTGDVKYALLAVVEWR